jgi:hypothetical protein
MEKRCAGGLQNIGLELMTPINYRCSDQKISDHAHCAGMMPFLIGIEKLTYFLARNSQH